MKMFSLLGLSLVTFGQDVLLENLLQKILQANGGAKRKILSQKTISMQGTMTMQGEAQKGTWRNDFAPVGKMVFENQFMGQNVLMKSDGKSTWSAQFDENGQVTGYQELQGAWAKMGAKFGDLNAMFLDFKINGVSPILKEDADWDGVTYHVIEYYFDGMDDLFIRVYFDRETYLPHVQQWSIGPPYILSDYREVEGIPFPFKRSQKVPQGVLVMETTTLEIGKKLDPNLFSVE